MTQHTQRFIEKLERKINSPTKICTKCKKEKYKNQFSVSKIHSDKKYPRCKDCVNEEHKLSYKINPSKFRNAIKKWENNNIHKKRAYRAVHRAIKNGKLIKPENCNKCNKTKKLDAHHWKGYNKENILDVQWLCRSCHKNTH